MFEHLYKWKVSLLQVDKMNVDKVNVNITGSSPKIPGKSKYNIDQTSFKSNIPQVVIENEINRLNRPVLRGINKLRNNIGEFQDICINAFGTGIIAPIFIKNNPISKTDEDTRTYSAWRQPLSAGLAIVTQGLITIPVVNLINNMANNGALPISCNKTPFKDEKYIAKLIKQLNPDLNKAQIDAKVLEYQKEQTKNLLNNLKKENTVYYNTPDNPEPIKIDKEKFKDLLNRTVDDMIKQEKDELNRCDNVKLQKRFKRSEFYRTHNAEAARLLDEMEQDVSSTENISEIKNKFKSRYKKLKSQKANQHLLDMLTETRDRSFAGKAEMLEKIKKMRSHVKKYEHFATREDVLATVQESLRIRKEEHNVALSFLENVKNAIAENKTISEIEDMFLAKSKEPRKAGIEFRLSDKIFSEEVASKLKALTKSHIEGVKRIATLTAALMVLPVSCSLLNWIYPRFMDAVFPKLSSKKHNNEAKELVDKATQNSGVKS